MNLVIMAAGMGSRFGGMKQIEPIGPNGEFIIDYSIYDAIRAGFKKVIFIIKREHYDIFRQTIGKRIESKIGVEYVFQENSNIPDGIEIPSDRVKPLGTAHAILCCKDVVKDNFAVINADDFYGYDAYKVISDFLKNNNNSGEYAMAGYIASNTLSKNGAVKRGVCEQIGNYLNGIIESSVERVNDKIIATSLRDNSTFEIHDNTLISMNLFAFKPDVFEILEKGFIKFLTNPNTDLLKDEYLITNVICDNIESNNITLEVLKTTAKWYGVTYKDDKPEVVEAINTMIEKNEYNKNLWQ